MKAIETTGILDRSGVLKLDHPLKTEKKQKVKVIILYGDDSDIDENVWLGSLISNPAFDFLKNEKEDIYSLKDGKPVSK